MVLFLVADRRLSSQGNDLMVIGSSSALFPVLVQGLLFKFVLVLNSLVCVLPKKEKL